MIYSPLGIYIHIPWCPTRCIYCDFNTYIDASSDLKLRYHRALLREIEETASALEHPPAATIFFGGGTPTTVPAGQLAELVEAVNAKFQLDANAEITVEANPGTLSIDYLRDLRQGGINRLSLGVQSFNDDELAFLSRLHTVDTARQSVEFARAAGFDNLSLDLIFNLPEQTLSSWEHTLDEAIKLQPEHLSIYSLIVEQGTPLQRQIDQGLIPNPDDDTSADMYATTIDMLAEAGYCHYEISNWAKLSTSRFEESARPRAVPFGTKAYLIKCPLGTPQKLLETDLDNWQTPSLASAHNLVYWRNQPYLGLGAGAYGTINGQRWANVKRPQDYSARVESGVGLGLARNQKTVETIDDTTAMIEHMLLGLRLVREGVSAAEFETRFGMSLQMQFPQAIAFGLERDLLEWVETPHDQRLRLTHRGRFLANQVIIQFMD